MVLWYSPPPSDFSRRIDALTFDIIGDLAFGRSVNIKEPGKNPLKVVPEIIAGYMKVIYPVSLEVSVMLFVSG